MSELTNYVDAEEIVDEVMDDNDGRIMTTSTLIKVGERYYRVEPLTNLLMQFSIKDFDNGTEFTNQARNDIKYSDDCAYIDDKYFYLYRGNLPENQDNLKPGIYKNAKTDGYLFVEPKSPEERKEYRYSDKITRYDADEIRNAVMNREVIIFNTPDASHSVIPEETDDDDILKKLVKRAISAKGIDLDQYRTRFTSKNMLFNTKQVLRGPNRLSMLLFDRCVEALNLKYTIILEDAGGEIIGMPLKNKIVISSHDVRDTNLQNARDDEE